VNIKDYRMMFYRLYIDDEIDFENSILSYMTFN